MGDSEKGVLAYMSILAKDTDLVGNLGLRKVSQLWAVHRDFTVTAQNVLANSHEESENYKRQNTWIFFLMAPKWVKMRPTDAFYTVYPQGYGSNFPMSAAGTSVLFSLSAGEANNGARTKEQSMIFSRKQMSHTTNVGRPGLPLIEEALGTLHHGSGGAAARV